MALWGGRFETPLDKAMEEFNSSLAVDQRLAQEDVAGSLAYLSSIAHLLPPADVAAVRGGLQTISDEVSAGSFLPSGEDIHTAVEKRLTELVGPAAGKLHTGRSRNDQVATDLRKFLLNNLPDVRRNLTDFISALVARAEKEIDAILPGYTHLQRAQPIRWAHFLLSHAFAAAADVERLDDLRKRISVLPLGSGALAGNPFSIDRRKLASELNFDSVSSNSLHAVADRDFVAEFVFVSALAQIHLSRLAEDLIVYSSAEFGFLKLSEAFSTGSSLMPQKRNPDSLELIRGKSGRAFGSLAGLFMTMKALPSAYNKDLQEDKHFLFDSIDNLRSCLSIATGVVSSLEINASRMRECVSSEMLATDLADYLVRKGVPFRETHSVAGKAVRIAETQKIPLDKLSLAQLKEIHPLFEEDVAAVWNVEECVERRCVEGGTSRSAVEEQIKKLKLLIS